MNAIAQYSVTDTLQQIEYHITYTNSVGVDVDFPLELANIKDAQINWDINELCVEGYVLFEDTNKLTELLPPTDVNFKIKGLDRSNQSYEESFIITRIERQITNNKTLSVRLDFIDKVYYYLSNCYIGKGYNNVTMDAIIKDTITNPLAPKKLTTKSLVFSKTEVTYDNFVTPQNRPFVNLIKNKEMSDGFSFFQSRRNINILSHKDLKDHLPDLSYDGMSAGYKNKKKLRGGIDFVYDTTTEDQHPFRIKTLKFLTSDRMTRGSILPNIKSIVFDYADMSKSTLKTFTVNSTSTLVGDKSTLNYSKDTTGYKRIECPSHDGIEGFYKFKIIENSLIEITVSGLFYYELLWKVGLDLKSSIQDHNRKMPYINGTYHILKIIDKYQGNTFNQIITLGRVGSV